MPIGTLTAFVLDMFDDGFEPFFDYADKLPGKAVRAFATTSLHQRQAVLGMGGRSVGANSTPESDSSRM